MQERLTSTKSTSSLQETSAEYTIGIFKRWFSNNCQIDFKGFFGGFKPVYNQNLTFLATGAINLI